MCDVGGASRVPFTSVCTSRPAYVLNQRSSSSSLSSSSVVFLVSSAFLPYFVPFTLRSLQLSDLELDAKHWSSSAELSSVISNSDELLGLRYR